MIFAAKAPYRISLLGGGSDLDWFVNGYDYGLTLGCAINKSSYVFLGSRPPYSQRGILNYSSREEYINVDSISHPLIRSVFKRYNVNSPIELASFGEASEGSGLGGSSSFLLALIISTLKMQSISVSSFDAAAIACSIEIEELSKPIGRQDQYLCALGGCQALKFLPKGIVEIIDFKSKSELISSFCQSLVLVSTGISRPASGVLSKVKSEQTLSVPIIKKIRDLTDEFFNYYVNPPVSSHDFSAALEHFMLRAWSEKKLLPGVMTPELEAIEATLALNGYTVLKLLGAGGGGYFLCKSSGFGNTKKVLENLNLSFSTLNVSAYGCQSWSF